MEEIESESQLPVVVCNSYIQFTKYWIWTCHTLQCPHIVNITENQNNSQTLRSLHLVNNIILNLNSYKEFCCSCIVLKVLFFNIIFVLFSYSLHLKGFLQLSIGMCNSVCQDVIFKEEKKCNSLIFKRIKSNNLHIPDTAYHNLPKKATKYSFPIRSI